MVPKRALLQTVFLLHCLAALGAASDNPDRPERADDSPPNIVLILADDLGWSELGCYGNGFNESPHLDRLASQGVRFTQAYAAAPVCSPYRAALLTGRHPARLGITDYLRPNSANSLSEQLPTLPNQLKANGYSTGMIGKWHLTGYRYHDAEYESRPRQHGFDFNIGSEVKSVGNGANFWPYIFRTQPVRWLDLSKSRLGEKEYLTDRLNLEALGFIERNKDRPFFLYLSHYAPHTILNGRPDLVEKYRRKHKPGGSTRQRCYLCEDAGHKGDALHHWAGDHNPHLAAMLESIDDGVGKITAKLKELGLDENTIVIFSSDNGGETNVTSSAPLRGGKSQLYEGGIRVPLIIRWPKRMKAGQVNERPTTNLDFFPTVLEAAGVPLQTTSPSASAVATIDGVSMLSEWTSGEATGKERQQGQGSGDAKPRTLYWHYPLDRPHFLGGESGGAIREGDWKLIEFFESVESANSTDSAASADSAEPARLELYSLVADISEQKNVAAQYPERAKRLHEKLRTWRESVHARRPSPPLLASPQQLYFADHFASLRASERWWFNGDWSVEEDTLVRSAGGNGTTRLFLRNVEYGDVIVRFDFQMRQSQDLRLVTGGDGHYNSVVHIRPDHFFIQTAIDPSGPYFSYRHGECAYEFDPNRWHSLTVEFLGDQLIVHVDGQHVAYAKHPIIAKRRDYFAFQVDEHSASFDNVQILTARKHPRHDPNLAHVRAVADKHPVAMALEERIKIERSNAHERQYQTSPAYRDILKRMDAKDALRKQRFPAAFRSHKESVKEILATRKRLLAEDQKYKELLFATHRAERAITAWLLKQKPGADQLPDSRRKREVERLRQHHQGADEYKRLVLRRQIATEKLNKAYPQIVIDDAKINQAKKAAYEAIRDAPEFRRLSDERAAIYREQQQHLATQDRVLAELLRKRAQP